MNTTIEPVRIWTDGACLGNPGAGGWAFLKTYAGKRVLRSGWVPGETTSPAMEMLAARQALRSLKRPDVPVILHTDYQPLARGMNEWLPGWIARGWCTAAGEPVAHVDIWKDLKALTDARGANARITFVWIKGHAECAENAEVDRAARAAAACARAGRC